MDQPKILETDVLVVGAGIAGMQAALDAADQGVRVVLAEKAASIGGRMINLSKVFPTLDCASCITTPRMASVAHHARIETLTHTEVLSVARAGNGFRARLLKKPRYVNEDDCTGCRSCELACPLDRQYFRVREGFDARVVGHRGHSRCGDATGAIQRWKNLA